MPSSTQLARGHLDDASWRADRARWPTTSSPARRSPSQELDINIVRALLYLQRADRASISACASICMAAPQRTLTQASVAALDPNTGDGRAFEIIECLGKLMWTVDRAALVFCIDQVEDLRFFDDPTNASRRPCAT